MSCFWLFWCVREKQHQAETQTISSTHSETTPNLPSISQPLETCFFMSACRSSLPSSVGHEDFGAALRWFARPQRGGPQQLGWWVTQVFFFFFLYWYVLVGLGVKWNLGFRSGWIVRGREDNIVEPSSSFASVSRCFLSNWLVCKHDYDVAASDWHWSTAAALPPSRNATDVCLCEQFESLVYLECSTWWYLRP